MPQTGLTDSAARLRTALSAPASSARLQAALTAGSTPSPDYIDVLIDQCAIEPDFFVRDMLTWALIRNDAALVTERLLAELRSEVPQARAQALHTLSKIGDPAVWPSITTVLLQDADDAVARAAWRTASGLVPSDAAAELAEVLGTQLGRGDRDTQLSLSRAFVALGDAAAPVVEREQASARPGVGAHAIATERIMADPEAGFDAAIMEAHRVVALRDAPIGPLEPTEAADSAETPVPADDAERALP